MKRFEQTARRQAKIDRLMSLKPIADESKMEIEYDERGLYLNIFNKYISKEAVFLIRQKDENKYIILRLK